MQNKLKSYQTTMNIFCSLLFYAHLYIYENIERTISRGVWEIKRFGIDRKSVTENLARLTYQAALGNMCRVSSTSMKTRKVIIISFLIEF